MTDPLNWDEFRIVNAIAETQSLAGAAERLGLNHSTMFRRLTALEMQLGFKLFERERSGYRPTVAGEDMVALAILMGGTIAEFERRVGGADAQFTGSVKIAALETLGCLVLPEILDGFRAIYPGLTVELTLHPAPLEFLDADGDIALLALKGDLSSDVTVRRAANARWATYDAPSLAATGGELRSAPWIGPTTTFGPAKMHRWLARNFEIPRCAAKVGSLLAMAELAAAGVGLALMPCYVAQSKGGLRRFGEAGDELDADICLAATPHALRKARVRTLFDYIGDEVERRRAWFEGDPETREV